MRASLWLLVWTLVAVVGWKCQRQPTRRRHSLTQMLAAAPQFSFRVLNSICDIDRETWDGLLGPRETVNPFLLYDWIASLEKSGCASSQTGWQPLHVLLEKDGELAAAIPLYAKFHSAGEFIFDHSWAEFAQQRLGIKYYPKLLSAVPFTPATGPRLLLHPRIVDDAEKANLQAAMVQFLRNLAQDNKVLSVNVNFMREEETQAFLQGGSFALRNTIQYRFSNRHPDTGIKFASFEDYLAQFKSKRRMQIRRERRSVYEEQKIRVEVIRGDSPLATPALFQTMFDLYTTTIDKMWGQQYLSAEFFDLLAACDPSFRKHIVFIVAFDSTQNDAIIAGTVNLASSTHFYGRYWGAFQFAKNLHFECCYYRTVQYCIEQGLDFLEPGAGGGEFKFLRGFDPFLINSVHYFTSANMQGAVVDFLSQEREANRKTSDYLLLNSAVGGGGKPAAAADDDEDE